MEVRWWMKELQWWGVSENVVTISCSCSHVTLWNKSAWIITGNSACCKSYSIQEVLEAAQASQHFRSLVFFLLFSFFIFSFQVSFFFSFVCFVLFVCACLFFIFFWTKLCESFWISMKYFWGCLLNPGPFLPPLSDSWWSFVSPAQPPGSQHRGTDLPILTSLGCAAAAACACPLIPFSHLYHGKVEEPTVPCLTGVLWGLNS